METPAQTCARLLVALEDLAAQEAIRLEARDFAGAVKIQERAAPLVEHLAAHGAAVAASDTAFRSRVAAFQARRLRTGEWIAEQMARTREQLQRVEASQRRATQIAPVYGGTPKPTRQLCAVG